MAERPSAADETPRLATSSHYLATALAAPQRNTTTNAEATTHINNLPILINCTHTHRRSACLCHVWVRKGGDRRADLLRRRSLVHPLHSRSLLPFLAVSGAVSLTLALSLSRSLALSRSLSLCPGRGRRNSPSSTGCCHSTPLTSTGSSKHCCFQVLTPPSSCRSLSF